MQSWISRAVLGGALAIVALAGATAQASADFEVHVKGSGEVARIGELRDPASATLPSAREVFGDPASARRRERVTCPARWPGIGLRIVFVDLGGGDPCTREGNAQTATLNDRRWSTSRGLHVGDPVAKARRLYPNARHLYGQLALVTRPSPFGDGGWLVPLGAKAAGGKVTALQVWLGGAGE
jgi:hypothetical protein